ncbi:hypothetical protein [Brevundimonas sp. GCM10030266]|uniref:hypothetical protein n=1 Tax=Brevundimonas sp. GCM10030266 TaxID=3273386 RepID=UPI00360E1FA9
MTYFCFVESEILSVPHMEPLAACSLEEAKLEAKALLEQHASGFAAHIFKDDKRVASIRQGDACGLERSKQPPFD